jgi:hypothetical protein
VPPDIGEAGDRRRGSAYLATRIPAEIEVGVPLFGVQLLPIAVRPDGSSALSRIRAKSGQTFAESPGEAYLAARRSYLLGFLLGGRGMRRIALTTLILALLCNFAAAADYRITQDYGGPIERYKAKYAAIRDRGERVIIDGVCNSACTLLLGIVPLNRVCVTPRASLGFHMPYYDMAATDGVKVVSYAGTGDFLSYYPEGLKDWLNRHGGLTPDLKRIKNGPELWAIVDPCPEEFF